MQISFLRVSTLLVLKHKFSHLYLIKYFQIYSYKSSIYLHILSSAVVYHGKLSMNSFIDMKD